MVAILFTGALVIALASGAPHRGGVERAYAALMTALVMTTMVGLLVAPRRLTSRPTFESLLKPPAPERDTSFRGLASVEQSLRFGGMTAGDFHARLRPLLAAIAEHRLAALGIRLDSQRDARRAQQVLGADLYEMVRPDAPIPVDRAAPGVPLPRIEAAVAVLESLR